MTADGPLLAFADRIAVVVVFEGAFQLLTCTQDVTLAQVSQQRHEATGRQISVAFYTQDERCLPTNSTIGQALANPSSLTPGAARLPEVQVWDPDLRPGRLEHAVRGGGHTDSGGGAP